MKKIVVSGSGKCREKIDELIKRLSAFYDVLNYPKDISKEKFLELYPHIHKEFYENIVKTDVFLLFNYDKDETKQPTKIRINFGTLLLIIVLIMIIIIAIISKIKSKNQKI